MFVVEAVGWLEFVPVLFAALKLEVAKGTQSVVVAAVAAAVVVASFFFETLAEFLVDTSGRCAAVGYVLGSYKRTKDGHVRECTAQHNVTECTVQHNIRE